MAAVKKVLLERDMKNPYKRTDVFVCNYSSHARFENAVSAYHVLAAKKCYPHGCMMYKWSCVLKNKGKRCVRGFSYVGRLCEGCNHYRDEKMHYQPMVRLSKEEFALFREEVEAFDEWLSSAQKRECDIFCRIDSVKPRFHKEMFGQRSQLRLDGYLLIIENGFIGTEAIEDYFYLVISPQQQERFAFAPGDEMDCRGQFIIDRGRILFPRIFSVEFASRSDAETWNNSRALVAREAATVFQQQPAKCLHCPDGALIDVVDRQAAGIGHRRQLICLQGVADWKACWIGSIKRSAALIEECPFDNNN